MKQILKWLETKISRHSPVIDSDAPQSPGRVQSNEPRKDVPIPNIYDCDDPCKQQQLKILEESPFVVFESTGYDPYNSGRFETSKLRSHK